MQWDLRILLVDDDPELCKDFSQCFAATDGVELVGITSSVDQALNFVSEKQPDVVILDLELHKGAGNGLMFLKRLNELELVKRPYVLVNTNNSSRTTYDVVNALGADFIMHKHQEGYCAREVAEFLLCIRAGSIAQDDLHTEIYHDFETESLRTRIFDELDKVWISPKSLGYKYLADAIEICCGGLMPNVSVIIGQKYGKSEASVERAMQNAIDKAWSSADIHDLLKHYTAHVNTRRQSPTVTEFICFYASKLMENR